MSEQVDMRKWVDMMSEGFFVDSPDKGLLTMDGFDDCIAGVVRRFNDVFVVYDQAKVIGKLMEQGMDVEAAHEFWDTNQAGAWVGSQTVGFLLTPDESQSS